MKHKWPASKEGDKTQEHSWWHQACLQTHDPGTGNNKLESLSPTVENKPTLALQCFILLSISREVNTMPCWVRGSCASCFLHSLQVYMSLLTEDGHDLYEVFLSLELVAVSPAAAGCYSAPVILPRGKSNHPHVVRLAEQGGPLAAHEWKISLFQNYS